MQRLADEIDVVSSLPPDGPLVEEYILRDAVKKIYATLTYEVHQVGARFRGDTEFILPRATPPITVADVYAYASIVQTFGFTVVYPQADS
jgi:hypothetical protein